MLSAPKVVTEGDLALSRSLRLYDLSWHAYILNVVTRTCMRTAPFPSASVVARVTFLSTVGMHAFCKGERRISYDIFSTLHEFVNDRMSWLDFVRACREVRKSLNLSNEFCDDVISHFRVNAPTILSFVDPVPGDTTADRPRPAKGTNPPYLWTGAGGASIHR